MRSAQPGFSAKVAQLMNPYWLCEAPGTYIIIKAQRSVRMPCWDEGAFHRSPHGAAIFTSSHYRYLSNNCLFFCKRKRFIPYLIFRSNFSQTQLKAWGLGGREKDVIASGDDGSRQFKMLVRLASASCYVCTLFAYQSSKNPKGWSLH